MPAGMHALARLLDTDNCVLHEKKSQCNSQRGFQHSMTESNQQVCIARLACGNTGATTKVSNCSPSFR